MPRGALTKQALEAALEATTLTDVELLKTGRFPTAVQAIKRGVRWAPEPPGDEHFDLLTTVLQRKWGDCDDLAPYHAASLRVTGRDRNARVCVKKTGPKRWHALVCRGNGTIEDPSLWAGMKGRAKGPRFSPVLESLVVGGIPEGRMAVHTAPFKGQRFARVDIPHIVPCDQALASCARGATERQAMRRALQGARVMGNAICCGPETMGRIVGAEEALSCATPGELYRVLRGLEYVSPQMAEDVVGFLGPLADIAKGAAGGALSKILPGGGAAAAAARQAAGAAGSVPFTPTGGGGGRSRGDKSGRSNNWLINTPPPIIVRY